MAERKLDRRAFTRKLAVGGGVAWMGPTIKSLFTPAAAASADGPPDPPPQSGCCASILPPVPLLQQAPPPGQPAGFTYVYWHAHPRSVAICVAPCAVQNDPAIEIVNGPGEIVEVVTGTGPGAQFTSYAKIPEGEPCKTHEVQFTWQVSDTLNCQPPFVWFDCIHNHIYTDPNCAP
jgi:hypothetical protein